jgi:protein-tyrosine-phosphatase
MTLFVCKGNVARSQIAEALYRGIYGEDAASAGTSVKPEKDGVMIKDDGEFAVNAIACFREISGIDISEKRRKPLTGKAASDADRIIVMVERSKLPEFMNSYNEKTEFWEIEDPKEYDLEGYRSVVRQITEHLERMRR